MSNKLHPDIPENMPRMGNAFVRWLGRLILRMIGWKMVGELPNVKKLMVIGSPHTSNWDFIVSIASLMALGLNISFFMKKEAFFWPFKGLFMKLGGIPIDRSRATDVVDQSVEAYQTRDKLWVGITPEGTRTKVTKWKSGFLRIAHGAEVPVLILGFHAARKEVVLDKLVEATDQFEEQAEELRQYTNSIFVGIRPENQ
jgi:1-acyl-sn-glycerol-3-phosphate acyltransferase